MLYEYGLKKSVSILQKRNYAPKEIKTLASLYQDSFMDNRLFADRTYEPLPITIVKSLKRQRFNLFRHIVTLLQNTDGLFKTILIKHNNY